MDKQKRSKCWSVFKATEAAGKEKCGLCDQILSFRGGTSNLVRHIKRKHPMVQLIRQNECETSCEPVSSDDIETDKKKRSKYWSVYKVTEAGKAKCGLCDQILSFRGGTSNLVRHIKKKHPTVQLNWQDECETSCETSEPVIGDDDIEVASEIANQPSSLESANQPSSLESANQPSSLTLPSTSTSNQSACAQSKITGYSRKPKSMQQSKNIDFQLVKIIAKEFQPLSLVEDAEFKKFVNMLNSSYSLPSRKVISTSIIPQVYNSTKEKIRNLLASVTAVAITMDGWTSVKNESFVAVTVHFIDEECEMKTYLLDCFQYSDHYSAENLATELLRILSEWNITEKVSAVMTDNTANMKAAVKECQLKHVPCFAHSVNFVMQAGIKEIHAVQQKVKSVVEFFRRSPQAASKLKNSQKQIGYKELKLKQDVVTRWNSTYEMLLRFVEQKEPVLSALDLTNPGLNQFNEKDWIILEKACDLLGVFQEVTVELSTENCVSVSKIILVGKSLINYVAKICRKGDLPDEFKKMGQVIHQQLSKRFGDVESNLILAESTILDPRYKKQGFENDSCVETVCKSLQQKVSSMNANINPQHEEATITCVEPFSSALWEDFDLKMGQLAQNRNPTATGIIELDKYFQEPNISRKENPLVWWRERKHSYPSLYKIMKRNLCIPAMSVHCGRMLSKGGQILTDQRNKLSAGKVSQLMFLNVNL